MHAASVHPEPGSNSLKNLYQTPGLLPLRSIRFSELMFYLSFFYFLSNKLLCFNEIPSHVLFVFEIPVVQFSMTDAASLSLSDLSILPHLFPFVNPFFELFSSFFGVFQVPSSGKRLASSFVSWVRLVYYIICFSFCQGIFSIFSVFFHFCWIFIFPSPFSILFLQFCQKCRSSSKENLFYPLWPLTFSYFLCIIDRYM